MRGVHIDDVKTVFIGDNVTIDSIKPGNLRIGRGCQIGSGTKIVTHFVDTRKKSSNPDYYWRFNEGKVTIEENVFLGFNVVIARPVTIGAGSIVGANSVVTQDVPPNTIVMGVPAVVVKHLNEGDFAENNEKA
jgi:maltose O-acetyltransferase